MCNLGKKRNNLIISINIISFSIYGQFIEIGNMEIINGYSL